MITLHYASRAYRVDLADRTERLRTPPRYNPYWNMLLFGRHIGYEKKAGFEAFWVARLRTKTNQWRRYRLGKTDDEEEADGVTVLTYEQACMAATEWFRHNAGRLNAADPRPLLPLPGLIFEPIGDEFTVVRAMMGHLEWIRVSAQPSHFKIVVSLINCHILPRIGAMRVDDISAKDIRRLIKDLIESPVRRRAYIQQSSTPIADMDAETLRKRRKTANAVISVLKQAFMHAWEDRKTDNERAWRACRPIRNIHRPRTIHLSREECRRLLACCAGPFRDLVLAALYTGCRVSELVALDVQDALRDGYGLYIKPGKTMRERFVFLPDEGMLFILGLAAGRASKSPLLPSPTGGRWTAKQYLPALKAAALASGMPDGTCFYVFRHTYASQLVQAGAPFLAVSEQLGHVDPTTVMRTYAHLSPQIREAEVRQRFTPIDAVNAQRASDQAAMLQAFREGLHGPGRDTYAQIQDLSSRDLRVH